MYRLIPLKVGECVNPGPRVFYLGDCARSVNLYNIFWALKKGGESVLVDTGFDRDFASRYMGGIIQKENENPLMQLKELGIDPLSVKKVILTHAHFDHLSPTAFAFRNATFYIQRKELEYVLNPPHPWFREFVDMKTVRELDRAQRFAVVTGDADICDGIRVVYTGGHSPGHQSVIVRTDEEDVILAGDVAFTRENLDKDVPVGFNCNLEECLLSVRKLKSYGCRIMPGHDPAVFD